MLNISTLCCVMCFVLFLMWLYLNYITGKGDGSNTAGPIKSSS